MKFRRAKKHRVLVYYDPETGDEEFIELKGKNDPYYGVVFSPSEIDRWIASHISAVNRRNHPQQPA